MSRYRNIHCLIWNDDKFPFASDACQLVFFHLITTPFSSPFGLYKASLEALAAEKRWELKAYREAFQEAFQNGFVKYDERHQVILLPHFLKYNPPGNPNVLKGWGRLFNEIPESPLKSEFYQELEAFAEGLGKAFMKAFAEGFGKPLPIQEQEQIQEQDQEYMPPYPPMNGVVVDTDAIDSFQQRYNQPPQLHEDEATVLNRLNEVTGRKYPDPGHIRTRLRDGATTVECLLVIDWLHIVRRVENPQWVERYLDNDTPFRDKVNFGKYLARAQPWHEAGRHPPQATAGQQVSTKGLRNMASTNRILEQLRKDTHD